jgi:hypothetical protein
VPFASRSERADHGAFALPDNAHVRVGTASLPVAFPAVDGVEATFAALVSQGPWTHVQGDFRTPRDADPPVSCWLLDDRGQWHIARNGAGAGIYHPSQTIWHALHLLPGIDYRATAVDIIITGPTTHAQATMPVTWQLL